MNKPSLEPRPKSHIDQGELYFWTAQPWFVSESVDALDLVGGRMLSACCDLTAIDGNLASVTDPPAKDDFETLFQRNASFHSIGANAYSLSSNQNHWKTYRHILDHISKLFDTDAIIKPPVTILGSLSVDTVKKAHQLLESGSVQGKLIMTSVTAGSSK